MFPGLVSKKCCWRTPGRFATNGAVEERASVLECAGPPALFHRNSTNFQTSHHLSELAFCANVRTPNAVAAHTNTSTRGTWHLFCYLLTFEKAHHFRGANRLRVLHRGLLTVAEHFDWQLEAWAVFSNHYHFVAHSPADAQDASSLGTMLGMLHVKTSGWINKLDGTHGRQVWFNFWDTHLTHQRSYLARLNYVHQNAVKHGLVPVACQYPWCSAAWFERTASPAMVKSIYRFKLDKISVADDFEIGAEW
jgi:putative transposase